jgi:Zn-finger nucleic acid-binding protein
MSRRARCCSHCQQINTIACVACHQAMDTQFVGGLQQDRCFRDHGFWLDHLAWIQIWDLPERYFETSPFQGQSESRQWSLRVHQHPSRQLQKKLQKHFAEPLRLRQGQGFAQDVADANVGTAQAALGSLGVIGFLGKGALRVGWNLFRIILRLG